MYIISDVFLTKYALLGTVLIIIFVISQMLRYIHKQIVVITK